VVGAPRPIGTAITGLIIAIGSIFCFLSVVNDYYVRGPEIRWLAEHGDKTTAQVQDVYSRGIFGEKCGGGGRDFCGLNEYVDLAWKTATGEVRRAENVWFDYQTRVTVSIQQNGFKNYGLVSRGSMLPILYDANRGSVAPILETELNAIKRWYGPYTIPVFTMLYGLPLAFGVLLIIGTLG
jgi:hypothetical protein